MQKSIIFVRILNTFCLIYLNTSIERKKENNRRKNMITLTFINTLIALTFIVLHVINKQKIEELETKNKILRKKLGDK